VRLTPAAAADKNGGCFAGSLAKQVTVLAVRFLHLLGCVC